MAHKGKKFLVVPYSSLSTLKLQTREKLTIKIQRKGKGSERRKSLCRKSKKEHRKSKI